MPVMPDYTQVHINVPLTNISVAYQQDQDFIADQVFPQVPVDKQGDLYYIYNKEDWFRIEATERGPVQESAGGGYNISHDSYFARLFALHRDIDDQTTQNADAVFNLERDATQWVTGQLLRKREKDFITTFLQPDIWANDYDVSTLPSGGTAWDQGNSTPIEDVAEATLAIQSTTGFTPNVLVLGAKTYKKLLNNNEIVQRVKYSGSGFPTAAVLAQAFDIDRIVVARAISNSSAEGLTASYDFMFSTSAFLAYTPNAPGLMTPAAGYTFVWSGLLGAGAYGVRMKTFRMENLEAERVEGELAYDQKLVGADLGAFFDSVVSS